MTLSCSCDLAFEEAAWWYHFLDYTKMPKFKRRKRCKSCGEFIDPGDCVVPAWRSRPARDEIEYDIYGEEIGMEPWWYCEPCGDVMITLTDPEINGGLGYCSVDITRPVQELLQIHRENMEV